MTQTLTVITTVPMKPEDMVERVAQSLLTCLGVDWETVRPAMRELYFAQARAAIAAMREPTEAMLAAAPILHLQGETPVMPTPNQAYRAMIDAALEPAP